MVIGALLATAAAVASPVPSTSIADLVEARDIADVAVSPDGRLVAFRTASPSIGDNRIHLTWYVTPVDGSAPARALVDGGDAEINGGLVTNQIPVWAPSSRALYIRAAHRGQVQLWRLPVDEGSPEQVTESPSDVNDVSLSGDGRTLSLTVGATRDRVEQATQDIRDNGALVDATIDTSSSLVDDSIVNGRSGSLRFTGHWFARKPLLWNEGVHRDTFELRKDDLTQLPAGTSKPAMIVRIDEKDHRQSLHWIDDRKRDRTCESPQCPDRHITSAIAVRNGRDVVVTVADIARAQSLWVWTPAAGQWRKLMTSLGTLDGGSPFVAPDCAPSNHDIVCVAAEPSGPPRLVAIDLDTGRTTTLFDPNAELRRRTWPTRAIRWTTSKGIEVAGQLMLPLDAAPKGGFPLVIDYYDCYGFQKGGLGDELPLAPLAQAGIATLCVDNPSWGANNFAWAMTTAVDVVRSVVDKLDGEGIVDRNRIGMAGLSFGESATMTVAERSSLLRAAAIASADIDPIYWWAGSIPGRNIQEQLKDEFEVDDPEKNPGAWKAHTAIGGLATMRTPLLMQLPESEMRMSVELYSRLANSPTPVEMVAYPNETHIKWEPRHKLATYRRNLDWFRFWLQGIEDPDPAKVEQYERWRAFSARPGYALPTQNHATP